MDTYACMTFISPRREEVDGRLGYSLHYGCVEEHPSAAIAVFRCSHMTVIVVERPPSKAWLRMWQ